MERTMNIPGNERWVGWYRILFEMGYDSSDLPSPCEATFYPSHKSSTYIFLADVNQKPEPTGA